MEHYKRKAVSADLKKFCHMQTKDSFIEVCEWYNGEGIDISMDQKLVQLTFGELDAIECLVRMLRVGGEDEG